MNRTAWYVVAGCSLLSAICTIAVLLDGPADVVLDAANYWLLGEAVAHGDIWLQTHPIAYRTPGYPWVIAVAMQLFGSRALGAIIITQGLASVLLVPLCAWMAAALARPARVAWAGPLAALTMSLFVSRLYFSRSLLGESLFVLVMMLHLASLVKLSLCQSRQRAYWALISGVLFGAMTLLRPIGFWLWLAHLFLFLPLLVSRLHDGRGWRVDLGLLRACGIGVCAATCLLVPWVVRNQRMFGEPFLTEFVGRNVWIVTFRDQAGAGLPLPESTAGIQLRERVIRVAPQADLQNTWDVSNALVLSGLRDDEADRLMSEVSVQAIRLDPGRWLERFVRRVVNYFRCVADPPPSFTGREQLPAGQVWWHVPNPLERLLDRLRFAPRLNANMVLAVVLGLAWFLHALMSRSYTQSLWLLALIAYFALITALVEIPDYRYRLVIEPLMSIVIGLGIADAWAVLKQRPATESPGSD